MNTHIQYIQKMTAQIAQEILTALIEGLVRVGCGLGGIAYENE